MSRSRSLLLSGASRNVNHTPSAEEIALRPELVKQLLTTVNELVYEHDLEHAVLIGLTPDGTPKIYHTYGKDLPISEVAKLLEDIAAQAKEENPQS